MKHGSAAMGHGERHRSDDQRPYLGGGTASDDQAVTSNGSPSRDVRSDHAGDIDASEVVIVVEIPRGGRAKFEIDPDSGTIWLDRVLSTSTRYPAEYGYVLATEAGDDDPLDAVVLLEESTVPGCHIRSRPIGVLEMSDEHGTDPKLLCVAIGDPTMGAMTDISEVAPHILEEIEHFFRVYKQLEPRAHVETSGWHGVDDARTLVAGCRDAYRRLAETPDDRSPS